MSSLSDLCYKCMDKRASLGIITVAGDHCHHEVRERPALVCNVCEDGPFTITVSTKRLISLIVKFCPECGRSLT